MRYFYTTNDSFYIGKGRTVTVKQLASIIKRDVDYGKWNIYDGGEPHSRSATCTYQKNGYIYHNMLVIMGKQEEFEKLEKMIKDYIKVIPRIFK